MSNRLPNKRNPVARLLASSQYRKQTVRNKKVYNRKDSKGATKGSLDSFETSFETSFDII